MSGTTVDRLNGITDGVAVKAPCRVATTANITLSGEQTIDGVAVVAGNRVLVKDQTDTTTNGIYTASTGTWARAYDFDGTGDIVQGTQVFVASGTASENSTWRISTASPAIGSALAFVRLTPDLTGTAITTSGLTMTTARVIGRTTASTGAPEEITVGDGLSLSAGALTATATGAITGSGLTQATGKMLGRSTAATGAIEEITVGSGLSLSAGTLTATGSPSGSITASGYTQTTARLLGRTTAATGAIEEISVGASLTLSGGTLAVNGGTAGITTIASGSLSGSSVSLTSIAATYAYLVVQITDASSSSGANLRIRVDTDNGASYDSNSGNYVGFYMNGAAVAAMNQASMGYMEAMIGSSSVYAVTSQITNYHAGPYTQFYTRSLMGSGGSGEYHSIGTYIGSTAAINAIEISISNGTFDAGTYALYGVS